MKKKTNQVTMGEWAENTRKIFPDCDFESDNYGQIIIYTGLTATNQGVIRKMTQRDFNGERYVRIDQY